jgi:hypothetical protein
MKKLELQNEIENGIDLFEQALIDERPWSEIKRKLLVVRNSLKKLFEFEKWLPYPKNIPTEEKVYLVTVLPCNAIKTNWVRREFWKIDESCKNGGYWQGWLDNLVIAFMEEPGPYKEEENV